MKDTVVYVNRVTRPSYPNWRRHVLHPEFERHGPSTYDLAALDLWIPDMQRAGSVSCAEVHEHLKLTDTLPQCLNLQDGVAIRKKGLRLYTSLFGERSIFLWKSVVVNRWRDTCVPYLFVYDRREVIITWLYFSQHLAGINNTTARIVGS